MPSFSVSRRTLAVVPVLLAAFTLGWALWEFQPRRQLEKAFARFVEAGERRDWKTASTFLAPNYKDCWGMTREQAISTASEWLGSFFVLEITTEPMTVSAQDRLATVRTRPRISGNGNAIAQIVMNHVNAQTDEMTFSWRRDSWKPWDWKLTSVDHPGLAGADY